MDCLKSKYGSSESFSMATELGLTRPNPSTVEAEEEDVDVVRQSKGERDVEFPVLSQEVEEAER